jgi:hypothetical protein
VFEDRETGRLLILHQPGGSGLEFKNNRLIMGIALSHDFDGKVLDPYGAGIELLCWICRGSRNCICRSITIQLV